MKEALSACLWLSALLIATGLADLVTYGLPPQ